MRPGAGYATNTGMTNQNTSLLAEVAPDVAIVPVNPADIAAAQAHLDNLTKPQGSLGRLEELARRLYAMRGGETPLPP